MSKLISNASRQIDLSKHQFTNNETKATLLSNALDNLFDFLKSASFLKIVFNLKTIVKMIKEIIEELKIVLKRD